MEQTNILERITPTKRVGFAPAGTEYALNIALLYEDTPTRKWAAQVCDQVTRLAGNDAVRCTWWEISRLSDPDVLMDASLMTMVADVVLVSIYDAKELPVNLSAWTDTWLPNRCLPMGALIALISVPGQLNAQTKPARDYLRAVARKGRMDFLLRERWLPETSRGYFYMEKAKGWTDRATSALQEAPGDGHKTHSH
ncbi:MAG: hypothetical protein ABSA45_01830 [Verrucomicrobiota bacterium]|jgi:hypothetical protein